MTHDVVRLCDQGGWKSQEWTRYTKLGTSQLALDVANHGWDFDSSSQSKTLVSSALDEEKVASEI